MKSSIIYLIALLITGLFFKIIIMLFPQKQFLIEILVLFFGLILTGIPHGAIDHLVARKTADKKSNKFSLVKFIFRYTILMLIYGSVWWLAPGFSLILFILFTAFHFGVTDLHYFGKGNKMISFLFGMNLTAWLLLSHQTELINWLYLILPNTDPIFVIINFLFKVNPIVFLFLAGLISFPKKSKRLDWVLFILLLILANQLGLIAGFAFYFSGWHGWQAFNDIKNYINADNTIIQLWKKAIPFTILSLVALLVVYAITPGSVWQNLGAPAVIILISLLTLPHMEVMEQVYHK
jgi:beta-carotene 15,15'-dioxygenase